MISTACLIDLIEHFIPYWLVYLPDLLCSAVFEVGFYIAQFVSLGEIESVTISMWIKV